MEKENFKLPSTVLNQLKISLNKHADTIPKPQGFSLIQGLIALEYATINQLNKIDSFVNNYKPSDSEEREKYKVLGDKLRAFATNTVNSEQGRKQRSNNVRIFTDHPTGTQYGSHKDMEVDRQNTVNTTGTEPATVTGKNMYRQLMTSESSTSLTEHIKRIKQLMTI